MKTELDTVYFAVSYPDLTRFLAARGTIVTFPLQPTTSTVFNPYGVPSWRMSLMVWERIMIFTVSTEQMTGQSIEAPK